MEENDEDEDQECCRNEKVKWDTDEYDYLDEDTGDDYAEKNIAACLIRAMKNSSNTQYLLDQN